MLSLELLIEGLKPGQKEAIQIKLAKVKNWKKELEKYEDLISGASGYKVTPEIDKKIKELKTAINAQIKQIKFEMKSQPQQSLPPELIKLLERDCGKYLKIFRNAKEILYRGTSGKPAFKGKAFNDRRPKDTSRDLHGIFIEMYKKMGITAHRGNSIFCTSDYGTAGTYGILYIIIPINNASFSYTTYADLNTFSDNTTDAQDYIYDMALVKAYSKKAEKIQNAVIKNDDRDGVWNSKWFKFDTDLESYDNIERWHRALSKIMKIPALVKFKDLRKLKKKLNPTDKNLEYAMRKELEVCIAGEYYAFKASIYAEPLGKWLGFNIGD